MPTLANTRHESFAHARVAGLTIDAAYTDAGYKPNRSNAARMNANEHIQQRIKELQNAAAKRAEIDAARVLDEIARLAFSDIRELFDQNGSLLSVAAIPEKAAKAIQSIKVSSKRVPGSAADEKIVTTEIKFWDKSAALGQLFKHFGLSEQNDRDDPVAAFVQALMGAARPLPVATAGDGAR